MTDSDDRGRHAPTRRGSGGTEPPHRKPFDIPSLTVTGLVIICELEDPPPGNSRPSMSMKMTQYLRVSDESMIRLDMDREVSSFQHGPSGPVSWKRSAADVIAEVLTLVKGDDATRPDFFPWEDYALAAGLRGIAVDDEALRDLPHTVLLSDELATLYEF
jgi:hypothetical protein